MYWMYPESYVIVYIYISIFLVLKWTWNCTYLSICLLVKSYTIHGILMNTYTHSACVISRPSIPINISFISRAFRETIRMNFGVCVCVCVCVCVQGISPSITGRILMKLHMDIPVHHALCVWQTIEHRSKVKARVTEYTKTTIWAVETSGWFQNVPCQNTYQKCRSPHDVWRNVFASRDVK